MITGYAGGHNFKNGVCDCGRALVDIQWVTKDDINKPHIAHSGNATALEIEQIRRLAENMRAKIDMIFGWQQKRDAA
jgi:hypothetical protein